MKSISDYLERNILLTDEAIEHIKERHPDIKSADIEETVGNPDLVQADDDANLQSTCEQELFYQRRLSEKGKIRYILVVVKFCKDGNFVSSAYKVKKPKQYRTIYDKDKNQ